jgi:hypothetical protein
MQVLQILVLRSTSNAIMYFIVAYPASLSISSKLPSRESTRAQHLAKLIFRSSDQFSQQIQCTLPSQNVYRNVVEGWPKPLPAQLAVSANVSGYDLLNDGALSSQLRAGVTLPLPAVHLSGAHRTTRVNGERCGSLESL